MSVPSELLMLYDPVCDLLVNKPWILGHGSLDAMEIRNCSAPEPGRVTTRAYVVPRTNCAAVSFANLPVIFTGTPSASPASLTVVSARTSFTGTPVTLTTGEIRRT